MEMCAHVFPTIQNVSEAILHTCKEDIDLASTLSRFPKPHRRLTALRCLSDPERLWNGKSSTLLIIQRRAAVKCAYAPLSLLLPYTERAPCLMINKQKANRQTCSV